MPVKLKSIKRKKRQFDFFCFNYKGKWLVQKRGEGDIWGGLYQFYLIENKSMPLLEASYLNEILMQQLGLTQKQIKLNLKQALAIKNAASSVYSQTLTHQLLQARFILIPCATLPSIFTKVLWVSPQQLKQLPFPKVINQFLESEFINWSKT